MTKPLSRLFCLTILIYSCSDKPKIDKDLIYSTLNDIIQQDSIFARVVCNKFDQVRIPDDIQKKSYGSNKKIIQDQIKNSSNAKMDTGRLYFYSRRKKELVKSFIDTT